jgi:tagatose 1,6-diphosphate aldolase
MLAPPSTYRQDDLPFQMIRNSIVNQRTLTLGKRRGLSQCAAPDGTFTIAALDHRQAIKSVFDSLPDPYAAAVDFKREVASALAPVSTAFLLDPAIGAGPLLADGSLPGTCGLVVCVEASGYAGPPHARLSRLPQGWDVARIKRMASSAVKLLVYYHPQSPTAGSIRDLVCQVSEAAQACDLPLFLEILTYSADPERKDLPPAERLEVILRAAEDLTRLGGDVLKAEFPLDVKAELDERRWEPACRSLTRASAVPWVLLSAGVDFEVFCRQAEAACKAGASGILAGRAIWKEALELPAGQRRDFLETVGRQRMQALGEICRRYAAPYTRYLQVQSLDEDWPAAYAGFW